MPTPHNWVVSLSTPHVTVGSMQQGKLIGFNASALKKQMLDNLVEVQTQRFIEYAEDTIKDIGNKIQTYNSRYHMDRTGNLLNSLCWGVSYGGKLKASGFYRDAVINTGRGENGQSFLHEFFPDEKYANPVNGRALAEQYIKQYGNMGWKGYWRVWFAILAPYWGYWEDGFTMKRRGKTVGFLKFSVMSEFHDTIKKDLSPAKVTLKVNVPTYSHFQLHEKWKREVFES